MAMVESDSQLREWWNRLTIHDRDEIVDRIAEIAAAPRLQALVLRMRERGKLGIGPSAEDLRSLKKWAC